MLRLVFLGVALAGPGVLEHEPGGVGVPMLDVELELVAFDPPLPAPAELDGRQLPGADRA